MSASSQTSASFSRAIPIRDPKTGDTMMLSESVGGTIYGTTPGGTRIIYDRTSLLSMRNSPLSKTPPVNMPNIPGVTGSVHASASSSSSSSTSRTDPSISPALRSTTSSTAKVQGTTKLDDDKGEMFEMD
eukprot:TRINITY_DN341_c0_g1_i1.p1 TRINITY_DN341_c0_g1~~TRINITY_DN341_c0_g1_i1.p1  ORF type:complete len:130 (-),score=39.94 TRINITY_DN341_c0_g1_i1:169-558(-)